MSNEHSAIIAAACTPEYVALLRASNAACLAGDETAELAAMRALDAHANVFELPCDLYAEHIAPYLAAAGYAWQEAAS